MYLDEIDRYRKAHVYDASNLSHKLDKHSSTKLFCSMNGSSCYVKVSTKGGKYYPLIYPESAGPSVEDLNIIIVAALKKGTCDSVDYFYDSFGVNCRW